MIRLKDYELEEKLFIYTLMTIIGLSIFSIIGNILIGFHFSINYKWIGAILLASMAMKMAFHRKYIKQTRLLTSFFILFIFMPIGFVSSGGTALFIGYLLLICIKTNYLYSGKVRGFLNFSAIAVFLIMVYIKQNYSAIFPVYDDVQLVLDMVFQVPLIIFLATLMLKVFSDAYRNERAKLQQYSKLLNKQNKELEKLSITDHLTGIYNRRYIIQLLEKIKLENQKAVTILIDLDNFKQINDVHGHEVGDKVIVTISKKIVSVIGNDGVVGRYGGDEFLIVLKNQKVAEGHIIAKKLLQEINSMDGEINHNMTVSGGIALYDGQKTIKEVIATADKLLLEVKGNGKNDILLAQ
jgi:diguanylate cyclase (GGDEF)-like protein